jgi:hypothetical protein
MLSIFKGAAYAMPGAFLHNSGVEGGKIGFIRLARRALNQHCRSRASGNPYEAEYGTVLWIPACAGMTEGKVFQRLDIE